MARKIKLHPDTFSSKKLQKTGGLNEEPRKHSREARPISQKKGNQAPTSLQDAIKSKDLGQKRNRERTLMVIENKENGAGK